LLRARRSIRARAALAVAALTAGIATFTAPSTADAFCGFYIAGADAKLFNNATLVVLMRDGTRTVLSMANNYQGPTEDFAMVVPVPVVLQKENVKTLTRDVFDRIDQLGAPRLVEYWEQDPCAPQGGGFRNKGMMPAPMAAAAEASDSAPSLGVKIEAQFIVGEYEIVILSANDSLGLDTWLRQEKYKIPAGAEPLLRPYVESGMKFFVAKVDVEKVKFEKGQAMLSPLRFHYDSDTFNLPVRLGLVNSSGTQDLIVNILAREQRFEVANYPNATIPTNLDVAEEARAQFGAFYAALFDRTIEKNPKAVITEYAWGAYNCDPCPGPALTPADVITLGADVLPSTMEMPPMPVVQVEMPKELERPAYQLRYTVQGAVQQCYAPALQRDRKLAGTLEIDARGQPNSQYTLEMITKDDAAFPPRELRECLDTRLREVRVGATAALRGTLRVKLEPMPNPSATGGFVLTRLHARYGKEALGEDLIFRQAPAIVGGREMRDAAGKLEHASQSSSHNNFQARYAIRHPWNGPMACAQPRRGVWGGPPAGHQTKGTEAARDLAFAPRGQVRLASLLRQDVPEIGVSSGRCACRVGGPASGSAAAAAAALVLGLGLLARRARRPLSSKGEVLDA
jgi:hypothetical protein